MRGGHHVSICRMENLFINRFMHMFQSSWSDFADFEKIFVRISNTISGECVLGHSRGAGGALPGHGKGLTPCSSPGPPCPPGWHRLHPHSALSWGPLPWPEVSTPWMFKAEHPQPHSAIKSLENIRMFSLCKSFFMLLNQKKKKRQELEWFFKHLHESNNGFLWTGFK